MAGCNILDRITCGSTFASCDGVCGGGGDSRACITCLRGANGKCLDCMSVRVGIGTPTQEQSELIKRNAIVIAETESILTTVWVLLQ